MLTNILAFSEGHKSKAKKKHTHYGVSAKFLARASQKTRKPCKNFSNESSMHDTIDMDINFLEAIRMDRFFLEKTYRTNFLPATTTKCVIHWSLIFISMIKGRFQFIFSLCSHDIKLELNKKFK